MVQIRSSGGYVAEVQAVGPDEETVAKAQRELERGALRRLVEDATFRWLSFGMVLRPETKGAAVERDPKRFRATVYDYTNQRTLDVDGRLDELDAARVTESARQPYRATEEFQAAVEVVKDHPVLGPAVETGLVHPYPPMPPFVVEALPDGRSRRLVTVGLYSKPGDGWLVAPDFLAGTVHNIVAVDPVTGEVTPAGPEAAEADSDCTAPVHDDSCSAGGMTGQSEITVTAPDGSEIWRLVAIRPRATLATSTSGTGVELLNVFYRGRSVFFQAHAPILNVEYQGATPSCGPTFRDWLYEESCFQAVGVDSGPGFRVCTEPPQTMIDAGTDAGSFRGVAVFFEGNDLLLVSEMQAGWYRYVTEWRLLSDGTIKPRFGFSAIDNFCTCQLHVHHAYYRFDWDIEQAGNNRVEEFNDPPELPTNDDWTTLLVESARPRDESRGRTWRVSNTGSGRNYLIVPGPGDGTADLYGGNDTWWLRYRAGEEDDGQGFTSNRVFSRERIDLFANGELLDGQDIVSWYAMHWTHDAKHEEGVGEFAGPDLICSWSEDIPEPTTTTTSSTTTTTEPTTTTTTEPTTTTTTRPGGGGGGGSGGGGGPGGGGGGGGGGGRP
jgi:uncharacterized membrane protein YgcG